MSIRYEIRFSGAGGQGIILISKIVAEAAAVYANLNATQTQSYGPEARGGSSKADVIVSDEEIDYPKAENLDVLLALTQEACDQYAPDVKEGGVIIADSRLVEKIPEGKYDTHLLPIVETAENGLKKSIVANIVALGAVVGIVPFVKPDEVEAAIASRVPRGTEKLNVAAFKAGMSLVQETKG